MGVSPRDTELSNTLFDFYMYMNIYMCVFVMQQKELEVIKYETSYKNLNFLRNCPKSIFSLNIA